MLALVRALFFGAIGLVVLVPVAILLAMGGLPIVLQAGQEHNLERTCRKNSNVPCRLSWSPSSWGRLPSGT